MALQQTGGRTPLHADGAVSSEQQGLGNTATQPTFIAAGVSQEATPDTDLFTFVSGAVVYPCTHANQHHLSVLAVILFGAFLHQVRPVSTLFCTLLTAVAVPGLRSKYGLNNRSAVQVIEDALGTDPEIVHQPAATSRTDDSQLDLAASFPQDQAQRSPQKRQHAASQAIVPAGV